MSRMALAVAVLALLLSASLVAIANSTPEVPIPTFPPEVTEDRVHVPWIFRQSKEWANG